MITHFNTDSDESADIKTLANKMFSFIPGISRAASVPVIMASEISEKEFHSNWVSNNRACLVKGAVRHWKAVQKWRDKDYWLTACDNFEVAVYPHQNYNLLRRRKMEKMLFYDAIERLYSNRDYVFSIPSEPIRDDRRFSGILKDIGGFSFVPNNIRPRLYPHRRFFIYRRAATSWHYHPVDETLMCQVNGTKKVVLLPPTIPRAKQVARFFKEESFLDGDTLDPSLDLKPVIAEVEEGDALYIPPYWYHAVVPMDGKIGFTLAYCWRSPWHILGNLSNYFVRKLYREAFWPPRKIMPALPFIACYTAILHYSRSGKKLLESFFGPKM